jgi:hypothetical protein
MKRIGWVGYVSGRPFFENTVDEYVPPQPAFRVVDVFKLKKDARARFEDVREVFVKDSDDRIKEAMNKALV